MREINDNVIKNDEFIIIRVAFKNVNNKKHSIKSVITTKLHVIDDFDANFLLNNDILISKDMIVDLNRRRLIMNNCENLKISIKMKTRKNFHVKRIIWAKQAYIVMFDEIIKISIIWRDRNLSNDRDLLFESNCPHYLKHENDFYASIVNVNFSKILVKNIIETSITLIKQIQLSTVTEYNQIECYLIMFDKNYKAIEDWLKKRSWKRQINAMTTMTTIYFVMIIKLMVNLFESTSTSFMKTSSIFYQNKHVYCCKHFMIRITSDDEYIANKSQSWTHII